MGRISPPRVVCATILGFSLTALAGCDRFGAGSAGRNEPLNAFDQQRVASPNGPGGQNEQAVGYGGFSGFNTDGGPARGNSPGRVVDLDQLSNWERQDFGIRAPSELHSGAMHGETPNRIPGGQVVTTKGLIALVRGSAGVPVIVLDVLGGQPLLPNAVPAVFAAAPGDFNDQTQQQLGQMLVQLTGGNRQVPVVTYCQGLQCWMSYNAALRAIALGYTNVLWYRGGVEAWTQAQSLLSGVGGVPPGYPQQPLPTGAGGTPGYAPAPYGNSQMPPPYPQQYTGR